jgi:FdhD protein
MSEGFRRVPVVRASGTTHRPSDDAVAIEEPLEVRLHDRPFAVIMRTPGADKDLAAGFLLSEGVIAGSDDLGAVEHCRHPHHPEFHNVVNVFLQADARAQMDRRLEERRHVVANSSCGLCGRMTIESLETHLTPLSVTWSMDAAMAVALPAALRSRQVLFQETGGLHAAGLFNLAGDLITLAEDVGRHNAVDKVIGRMLLLDRVPLRDTVLVVSGRTSFEIVQKAWMAGVEMICAVSAPSSLAIDLAESAGITLLGFVREPSFNIYSHRARVRRV